MSILTRSFNITKALPVLLCGLLLCGVPLKAQTNLVPDDVELAVLKNIYDSLGGAGWKTKTNWPTLATWPATATSAQFGTWYGVTVANGDITKLTFSGNILTGTIPKTIRNLSRLTRIYFYNNKISGPIPATINQLTNLTELMLAQNDITGSIPDLSALGQLTTFDLSGNTTLTAGPIPSWITSLTSLTTLNLTSTQRTGPIPGDIGSLVNLTTLYLNSNQLTGPLPSSIGSLVNLTTLYLHSNQLTGSIPSSIGGLTSLTTLYVYYNDLSGALPSSLGSLSQLQYFAAFGNQLSGAIPPELGGLHELLYLRLLDNQLSGPIPSTLQNLTKLQTLDLSTNQLSGEVPSWLGSLDDLVYLRLADNRFTGELPESLGNLTGLKELHVWNNKLTGPIPASYSNLSALTHFYVYNNQLSGPLPELGALTGLQYFYVHNNYFSGPIPFTYGNLTNLIGFNVENNNLEGPVPSSVGNWTKLTSLSLNNNKLTGDLPTEIGNCKLITSLRAQYNKFTSIPASVLTMPVLATLNFSYNELTSIPDFSAYSNKANLNLSIQNNFLGFDKLEPQFNSSGVAVTKTLAYNPQNLFNEVVKADVPAGNTLELTAAPKGQYGSVTWEKNLSGTWTSVNVSNGDATQQTYQVANVDNTVDGAYHWTITNTRITALTLQSSDIAVQAVDAVLPSPGTVAQYGGLISSVRWRTNAAYGTGDADLSGMHVYTYDDKYQIQDASWAEPSHTLNTFTGADNKYRLTGMVYDPNGNIQSLSRYDKDGARTNNFTYSYEANKNKLTSVTGYTNAYTYNAIGQMVGEDKVSGDDQYVDYDVTGKVVAIYDDVSKTSKKVEYLYDDRGFRLAKVAYRPQGGGSARTTWYIRDASGNVTSIYEQEGAPGETNTNPLIQKEVPVYGSGKLGTLYPQQDGSMAYEITDHLGNVRALVRENVIEYKATMEDNGQADITNPRVQEMNYFQNLFETEQNDVHMNHTPANATIVSNPSKSAYLFWQSGMAGMEAVDKAVGPAIALKVTPGDTIHAETFVRYENKTSYNRMGFTLSVLSALLGNSFAYVEGFEGSTLAQATQKFSTALTGGGFFGDTGDDTRPYAYLNYIVFDESMARVASEWIRVTEDGGFDPGEESLEDQHERVALEDPLVIPANGKYIYLWVSNESENTKVWFDDLTVTHVTTYVTESTDYGVWGDVLRTSSAEQERKSVKDNLIAHYKFSSNANDNSGHNLNGTVTGATLTTDQDGTANQAYAFDGNDYIALPSTEDDFAFVQNTGVFTISAFVRLNDLSLRGAVIGTSSVVAKKGFELLYETTTGYDHQLRFVSTVGVSGKLNEALGKPATISDNGWHHVAVVGDGQTVRIFVDGAQDGYSSGLLHYSTGDASAPAAIGSTRDVNGNPTIYLRGGIDEVHIFNKALSDAEIRLLANGSSPEEMDKILEPEDKYRYQYQGQFAERDLETGWSHFELREYDPVIGRWTSKDPYDQYWSPYIGMRNSPINYLDFDGGYSRGGALWRQAAAWVAGQDPGEIYKSGSEWGFAADRGKGYEHFFSGSSIKVNVFHASAVTIFSTLNAISGFREAGGGAMMLVAPEPTALTKATGAYYVTDGYARMLSAPVQILGAWTGNETLENAPGNAAGVVGLALDNLNSETLQTGGTYQNLLEIAGDFGMSKRRLVESYEKGVEVVWKNGYEIVRPFVKSYFNVKEISEKNKDQHH